MGQIQSSVNQTVGAASLMAGLYANSPAGKLRAEKAQLKKQESAVADKLRAHIESARGADESNQVDMEERFKTQRDLGAELEGIKKRQFDLSPNKKTYDQYLGVRNVNKGMDNRWAEIQQAKLKAQQSMEASQEEKRNRVPIYGAHGEVLNG